MSPVGRHYILVQNSDVHHPPLLQLILVLKLQVPAAHQPLLQEGGRES